MPAQERLPQVSVNSTAVLTQLHAGQLLAIDPGRVGGLIICKRHHAEFAGPGSAVGGVFDLDCVRAIAVGDLALVYPNSYEARQQAYASRQQWFAFTQEALVDPVPLRRGQAILTLLEQYFDPETLTSVPDNVLALLVGVFPQTMKMVRQSTKKPANSTKRLPSQAPKS